MVGGNEEGFNQAKKLLSYMGKNSVYCGKNGNGLVAKICNNMLLAIHMIGLSETLNLGTKYV